MSGRFCYLKLLHLLLPLISKTSLASWHYRLGHPSASILNTLVSRFSLHVSSTLHKNLSYSDCLLNKSHKLPFSQTSIVSTRPLDYVFTDLWTSSILSIYNFKYYLVMVDHFSRCTWIYPLKQKSQVKDVFIAFKALVENKIQTRIGTNSKPT